MNSLQTGTPIRTRPSKRQAVQRLPILMYHGVIEDDCEWSQWTQLRMSQFVRQMDVLAANYNVISLTEAIRGLVNGEDLPPRAAVITFDDGFQNVHSRAFPVLRKRELPATVFMATGLIDEGCLLWADELFCLFHGTPQKSLDLHDAGLGRSSWTTDTEREQVYLDLLGELKRLPASGKDEVLGLVRDQLGPVAGTSAAAVEFRGMSWNNAREMQSSGLIEFGGHTVTHQILSQLDESAQAREISDSCERVRDELGSLSPAFCYPNGQPSDFTEWTKSCVRNCGLDGALSTIDGLASSLQEPFELRRIPVGDNTSLLRFRLACNGTVEGLQGVRQHLRRCWKRIFETG